MLKRGRRIFSLFIVLCMLMTFIQPAYAGSNNNGKVNNGNGKNKDLKISGVVWEDLNEDGLKDEGEPLIEGIKVYSHWGNGNNEFAQVESGSDGSFEIGVKNSGNDVVIKVNLNELEIGGRKYRLTTDENKSKDNGSKVNIDKDKHDDENYRRTDKFKPSETSFIGIGLVGISDEEQDDDVGNDNDEDGKLIDISRSISKQKVKQGESVEVTYTLTPKPIGKTKTDDSDSKKEIVLVIDTSGSMNDKVGNKKKIVTMKKEAKEFADKFKDSENVKIGVVEYSSYARRVHELKNVKDTGQSIKGAISSLGVNGATNIGDGVRTAKTMLDQNGDSSEKYIILMTDGEATAYSRAVEGRKSSGWDHVYDRAGNYEDRYWDRLDDYFGPHVNEDIYHNKLNFARSGYLVGEYISYLGKQNGTDAKSLHYAKNVVEEMIKDDGDVKGFFVVGFGAGAGESNSQIASAAGGKGSYYCALNNSDLEDLYDQFASEILESGAGVIDFEENIFKGSEGLQNNIKADKLPQGLEFENGCLKGNLNAMYRLNDEESGYTANLVEFTVEYTFEESGEYVFGDEASSFVKMSVFDKEEVKNFNEGSIIVEKDEDKAPDIQISVTDTSGTAYRSRNADGTDNPELFEEGLLLKGSSVADMEINGENLSDARYKIIQSDGQPSMPSESEMIPINDSIEQETIYPDLVKDKSGYLNARNYDVSHLETLSDKDKWNDRRLVFQSPSSTIEYRSADTASTVGEYITKVNGSFKNHTIFMENMNVGGEYNDYKESAKFWGYITPPETGDYYFGLRSDDGSRGYIIVQGEKLSIADQFTIHGSQFRTDNTKMSLQKDEYYPIYLEYSNWGGWADHSLIFKRSKFNSNNNDGHVVPADWFRPTRNNNPGEIAEETFESTAVKGVPFPEEKGTYYVAVKAENSNGASSSKLYGPFVVGLEAEFEISRSIEGPVQSGEFLKLKYKVDPVDIEIGNAGDKLTVNNFIIKEIFQEGITIGGESENFGVEENSIVSIPREIVYNYNRDSGVYSADGFEVSIMIKTEDASQGVSLGENESAFVSYEDFDGSQSVKYFEAMTIEGESYVKPEEFNVLEIQPERKFELNEEMFADMGHSVSIVQMSMREFIGSIEDVNGKYDLIYIGSNEGSYSARGERPGKSGTGQNNGKDSEEYYSENDITYKKASEIEDYIESGQTLAFERNMFSQNEDTKLSQKLEKYISEKANVIELGSPENEEELELLIAAYKANKKRPALKVSQSPKDYDGKGNDSSYEDDSFMSFRYDVKSQNNPGKGLMNTRLYLDIDGDGLFEDDELVKTSQPQFDGEGYTLSYRIEGSFSGMMPWKIEVVDRDSGTKNYKTGYPAYNEHKIKVRVLQLIPPKGNSFYIKDMKVPLNTDYYEVDVETLTTKQFNDNYPNVVIKDGKQVPTVLNGNYDMIVLGFKDAFAGGDLGLEEIGEIKEFISTGQGVMFTHDTMSYHVDSYGEQCKNLTQKFRDIVGQARYYNGDIVKSNSDSYDDGEEYYESIPHDSRPDEGKKSYGFTNTILDVKNKGGLNHPHIKTTYRLNDGLFTKYPYMLADNKERKLSVAKTHEQYFQLNLEDEDVIPWFTLNGKSTNQNYTYNKFDGRNNYYTYTKGNITYSGTGHEKPGGVEEHEMFMNTILKASRSANHAPTIEVVNLDENEIISTSQEKFEFSFIADDIDGDELTGKIYINGVLVRSYEQGQIKHGEPVHVSITKYELKEIIGEMEGDKSFSLKIEVVDSKGAMAEENSDFTISYFANPVLSIESELSESGYLVGDRGRVDIWVKAQGSGQALEKGVSGISFAATSGEGIGISGGSWSPSDISFSPDPDPQMQKKTFEFTANIEGNHEIENVIEYDCPDFEGLERQLSEHSYVVPVKKGRLDIIARSTSGKVIEDARVTITKIGGESRSYEVEGGTVSINDNLTSGRYEISIDVDDPYIVKGRGNVAVELSYDESYSEIEFVLVDKNDISLELESDGPTGCLVGDRVSVIMKAQAQSGDEETSTTIEDIEYSMEYSGGLEPEGESSWGIQDVNVDGTSVSDAQTREFTFTASEKGDQEITGTVVYKYLDGIGDTRSATHGIDVKRGMIQVKALSSGQTPFREIEVTVSGENYEETLKTDETGKCVFYDMPSGEYSVSIDLPEGVSAQGGNESSIAMSYENSECSVDFIISDKVDSFNHGKFSNGKVVEVGNMVIPKGANVQLGVDLQFYGNPAEQDIILTLDGKVTSSEFEVVRADEDGNLVNVSGFEIYRASDSGEEGSLAQEEINGILSGSDQNVQFKIVLPENEGQLDNHYIIKYKVKADMEQGEAITNTAQVNGGEPRSCIIRLANSLSYT